ncbi:hypothetical protein Nmel_018364 [Mimus melanotis]
MVSRQRGEPCPLTLLIPKQKGFLTLLLVQPAKGKVAATSLSLGRAPELSGVQVGLTKAFQESPGLGLLEG